MGKTERFNPWSLVIDQQNYKTYLFTDGPLKIYVDWASNHNEEEHWTGYVYYGEKAYGSEYRFSLPAIMEEVITVAEKFLNDE